MLPNNGWVKNKIKGKKSKHTLNKWKWKHKNPTFIQQNEKNPEENS